MTIAIVYTGSFIVGMHWQVEGVAVAYAIAFALLLYPSLAIPFRFIDMKFWYYAKQFRSIVVATVIMTALIYGLRVLLETVMRLGSIPILVSLTIVGTACYIGLLTLFDRALLGELLGALRDLKMAASAGDPNEEAPVK